MTIKELVDSRHPFPVAIVVCSALAGQKKAVWDGSVLHVSPAMKHLLSDPEDEGVEGRMAAAIPVTCIPRFNLFTLDIPMTTSPRTER